MHKNGGDDLTGGTRSQSCRCLITAAINLQAGGRRARELTRLLAQPATCVNQNNKGVVGQGAGPTILRWRIDAAPINTPSGSLSFSRWLARAALGATRNARKTRKSEKEKCPAEETGANTKSCTQFRPKCAKSVQKARSAGAWPSPFSPFSAPRVPLLQLIPVIVNMEAFGAGTIYLLPRTLHPSELNGGGFLRRNKI